ncbi:outer membrane protein [Wolbachia endosymbiont of Ctenocephalides felis wCfeT]|uniref:outer membrane protein n=1 Tax=Wolbachia endosymbiont of Ctenocephalides felis wCfeT TaxID=2732593 RepID=UPI0014453EA4|nr:P44/Msp2 family outer membrane protein [Wolbachia endosymbiont of Ctenocephalides felis wCfeT]
MTKRSITLFLALTVFSNIYAEQPTDLRLETDTEETFTEEVLNREPKKINKKPICGKKGLGKDKQKMHLKSVRHQSETRCRKRSNFTNIFSNKLPEKKQTKKLNFYVSANSGKVYHDNSEILVEGIKTIGKRVSTLTKNTIIEFIAAKEIKSIENFKGEIDFQWLNSIALGYYAGENGQVDFEAMYSKVKIKDSSENKIFDETAGIFAFLLNLYYNPNTKDAKCTPYIGLGVGPTVFRLKKFNGSPEELMPMNVPWFAYQIKLGVSYSIIPEIRTFLGYRYFSIPIPVADDISTHNIEAGLQFNF